MGKNQGRTARIGNNIGHGKCFSRPGYAQQCLECFAVIDAFSEGFDSFRLITRRIEIAGKAVICQYWRERFIHN